MSTTPALLDESGMWLTVLGKLVSDLKSKNEELRIKSVSLLSSFIGKWSIELYGPDQVAFVSAIRETVSTLLSGTSLQELLAGIATADWLVDTEHEETAARLTLLCKQIDSALQRFPQDLALATSAASALGRIAHVGGSICADAMELQGFVRRALEWMAGEWRLAGALVVKAIAENMPAVFFVHAPAFVSVVRIALADKSMQVRLYVYAALCEALSLCSERNTSAKAQWLRELYDGAHDGIGSLSTSEVIHASFLTFDAMLTYSPDAISPHFSNVCSLVLNQRNHKDVIVRNAVIQLLPKLAKFMPSAFIRESIDPSIKHLLLSVEKGSAERTPALFALGDFVEILGTGLECYSDEIVDTIITALNAKKTTFFTSDVITCSARVAKVFKSPKLEQTISSLIPNFFSVGLSPVLIGAMNDLCTSFPGLISELHKHVFDVLSQVLSRKEALRRSQTPIRRSSSFFGSPPLQPNTDSTTVVLALKTVGSFNMSDCDLLAFANTIVVQFLSDESLDVRKEAASACANIMLFTAPEQGASVPTRGHAANIIDEILTRMIDTAVASPDSQTRLAILSALGPSFDYHLAQAHRLSSLFLMLNDESFDVRDKALTIVGRVVGENQSPILPTLRMVVLKLLATLRFGIDLRMCEQASLLLARLIRIARSLARLLSNDIINALLPQLLSPSTRVSMASLRALGELAAANPPDMTKYINELVESILEVLRDNSPTAEHVTRREIAVWTFGQIVRATGYVIQPLLKYPDLLQLLLSAVSTERSQSLRIQLVKLIGILGAVDPYVYREMTIKQSRIIKNRQEALESVEVDMPFIPATTSEYNALLVIHTLTKILRDPTLSTYHKLAMSCMAVSFQSLEKKCIPHLRRLLQPLFGIMRICKPELRVMGFQIIVFVTSISETHIREFVNDIEELMFKYWDDTALLPLLSEIEYLSISLSEDVRPLLVRIMPHFLKSLATQINNRTARNITVLQRYFECLEVLGFNADEHVHLIVPLLSALFEKSDMPPPISASCIRVLAHLCRAVDISAHLGSVVRSLLRLLETRQAPLPKELSDSVSDAVTLFVKYVPRAYAPFIPFMKQALERHSIQLDKYNAMTNSLSEMHARGVAPAVPLSPLSGVQAAEGQDAITRIKPAPATITDIPQSVSRGSSSNQRRMSLNAKSLQAAWETSRQRCTKEDWLEWHRQFSLAVLHESPSQPLRACYALAQEYTPLVRDLFGPAFLTCWDDLPPAHKEQLVRSLDFALQSAATSQDVTQSLLNLFEFMEREERPLTPDTPPAQSQQQQTAAQLALSGDKPQPPPTQQSPQQEKQSSQKQQQQQQQQISHEQTHGKEGERPLSFDKLGLVAVRCRSYAKALRIKEIQYQANPRCEKCIEGLISINNQLQLPDAASGVLLYAQRQHAVKLQESWYEKLGRWHDALSVYERKLHEDPMSSGALLGTLRCLKAIGEHGSVEELAGRSWATATPELKKDIAAISAESAWSLHAWDALARYTTQVPESTVSGGLYRAILEVRGQRFSEANRLLSHTRSFLDTELAALVGESYDRAYPSVVRAHQLAEIEEVMEYLQCNSDEDSERRKRLRATFRDRLRGVSYDVDTWQAILRVRELAVDPRVHPDAWVRFVGLCRKRGLPALARHTLEQLAGGPSVLANPKILLANAPPRVSFAYAKLLWSSSADGDISAKQGALGFLRQLRDCIEQGDDHMQARIHFRAGQWQLTLSQLQPHQTAAQQTAAIREVVECFHIAEQHDPRWYKALHAWASINADLAATDTSAEALKAHLDTALHALISSIYVATGETIQDVLRFLTLCFRHGAAFQKEVDGAVREALSRLNITVWLQVLPQIIARVHSGVPAIQHLTYELLTSVGRHHPQALVFPLTVAAKSPLKARAMASRRVLERMSMTAGAVAEQAASVSHELVRLSVVWHEMWFVGINEASRLCYEERDPVAMWAVLAPLYDYLDKGADTPLESSFVRDFGPDLQNARACVIQYQKSNDFTDLQRAWDTYYNVFGSLEKLLKSMTAMEVRMAAPRLAETGGSGYDLAVPGTYSPLRQTVTIREISQTLPVISSKQRPRRLTMIGSNGAEYLFLLKAHEDLRQDERAMQVFGLVNSLLSHSAPAARDHLQIVTYAVVPLAPNSGLIGWVLHSDTLHELIKEHRESRKIVFDLEFRLQKQMFPLYDLLTLPQKVEVLQWIFESTDGMDLRSILWRRSPNAEAWLMRRTRYTRSLAVMSMVGHILGIGDRHPSNLMLDRDTGDVIHIDFGDCFETAMHRQTFPEKIPFRLTRMLVNAMEVSGVEGTYRLTCEKVMSVLRENRDSLLAVLETFVYDPLINWRLLPSQTQNQQQQQQSPQPQNSIPNQSPAGAGAASVKSIGGWDNNDDILLHIGETPGGRMFQPNIADPESTIHQQRTVSSTTSTSNTIEAVDDTLNERALSVMRRVTQKLDGREMGSRRPALDVHAQVERLISQATDPENLASCYRGWCPFW